jgi:AAA family ATP:ADP antiporter
MASNPLLKFRKFMIDKVLDVKPHEFKAVGWSLGYFFCVLASYYILRPIRESLAVGGGPGMIPYLFMGTFALMMVATPIFGWVTSRYSRQTFLPWIYLFFISNILIFWALFLVFTEGEYSPIWLGRTFFLWLSVFNLFVVSVFWSFMADIYTRIQGRRLFGLITAGGSVGALVGGGATQAFVEDIGTANLFPIAAAVLSVGIICIGKLREWITETTESQSQKTLEFGRPLGGNPFAGITHVLQSNYFLAIAACSVIASLLGTALYMFAAHLVADAIPGETARIAFFANINNWANFIALIGQMFLVRHVVIKFGIGRSLAIMPIISILGFAYLAIDPILGVVALLTIARRGLGFAFSKPPTDMLYSAVTAEEKYKAKNFIETAIYRFGDIVGTWTVQFMMWLSIGGILILTLSIAEVSVVMLPFAALWLVLALWLGREYKRKAITLKDQGVA